MGRNLVRTQHAQALRRGGHVEQEPCVAQAGVLAGSVYSLLECEEYGSAQHKRRFSHGLNTMQGYSIMMSQLFEKWRHTGMGHYNHSMQSCIRYTHYTAQYDTQNACTTQHVIALRVPHL